MKKSSPPVFPTAADIQLACSCCFLMSLAVLVLGFWNLFSVEATAIQTVLGSLLILNLSAVSALAGVLIPLAVQRMQLIRAEEN